MFRLATKSLVLVLLLGSMPAQPQAHSRRLEPDLAPLDHKNQLTMVGLSQRAAYIFNGTVVAVVASPTSYAVSFHVNEGFLGVKTGEELTVHEWSGLWTSGVRYRSGEKLLLFLSPPNAAGLTSPVANGIGRFVIENNRVRLTPVQSAFLPRAQRLQSAAPALEARYKDVAEAVRRSLSSPAER